MMCCQSDVIVGGDIVCEDATSEPWYILKCVYFVGNLTEKSLMQIIWSIIGATPAVTISIFFF